MGGRDFIIPSAGFEPAYLALHRSGVLRERAGRALAGLAECESCPRRCGVDRPGGEIGICRTGRYARVTSAHPHYGEEDCLRGREGSGTIFFSRCNLRCVFCLNDRTSQGPAAPETAPARLTALMLALQEAGCHNINLVSPSHVVPQILEALVIAADLGMRLPLVYNTSAYDSVESLRLLDGVVDIYMPDFKFWDDAPAERYVRAPGYPDAARRAIREMHRQVGDLMLDEDGIARRGLLVRHLVMPGDIAGTRSIMQFLGSGISRDTYINVMDQYHPAWRVMSGRYPEIDRSITTHEYEAALEAARRAGLHRFDAPRRF